MTGLVKFEFRNIHTGKVRTIEVENLITDAGKNSIALALKGTTSKGEITYCAVGTDATAPDAGDTVLGVEIERKLVSVRSTSSNITTFQTFFTTSEANGTLAEAGLFGDDASGTVDTGTLYAHTAISKTKTSSETLTISWTVTIG